MASICTICSHSALQIFHGARREGIGTIGIIKPKIKKVYDSFPLSRPDRYLQVADYTNILDTKTQESLINSDSIIVPHGSFIQYVGADKILKQLRVRVFGNKASLKWESSRKSQQKWMEKAKIKSPKTLRPNQIKKKSFVKFSGAHGGSGFFTVESHKRFTEECKKRKIDPKTATIQEFIPGNRYYLHFFYSAMRDRLEFFGADRRIEIIDESYRGLPNIPKEFFDYTVTGNEPVVLRESLLSEVFTMGEKVLRASKKLFGGMSGPFCLETVYTPRGFVCFEISARIVAGTNLYPQGSPYTSYLFGEPVSTGRRIAMEIGEATAKGQISKVTS